MKTLTHTPNPSAGGSSAFPWNGRLCNRSHRLPHHLYFPVDRTRPANLDYPFYELSHASGQESIRQVKGQTKKRTFTSHDGLCRRRMPQNESVISQHKSGLFAIPSGFSLRLRLTPGVWGPAGEVHRLQPLE